MIQDLEEEHLLVIMKKLQFTKESLLHVEKLGSALLGQLKQMKLSIKNRKKQ